MTTQLLRKRLSNFQELVTVIVVGVLILLTERVGWGAVAINRLQTTVVPLASQVTSFVLFVEQPLTTLNGMYAKSQELQALRVQHAQSLAQLTELENLKKENQQLRQMIENRHLSLNERSVAAPIVSYGYPAVAAGENQSVRLGSLVMAADTLLGRVIEVGAQESRIELLSSRESQPVLAKTESGLQGLVKGSGRGVVLTQLPPDAEVTQGERISTVGQPGIKPDIFIGIVSADQTQATAPIKTVPIDQLVSFYSTQLVELW